MLPYFKSSFLNWLRDEVILTLTRSKVTVLHFFMVVGPAAGIGAGMGYGESRTWVHSLVGATVGGIAGVAIAWPLPRVIFHALHWLIRKRWFLRFDAKERPPTLGELISTEEFETRVKAYDRRMSRANRALLLSIIPFGILLGLSWRFRGLIERHDVLQAVCGGILVAYVSAGLSWEWRRSKRAARESGITCPGCGHLLTDATGMIAVPWWGRCKECGLKIIDVEEEDTDLTEEN